MPLRCHEASPHLLGIPRKHAGRKFLRESSPRQILAAHRTQSALNGEIGAIALQTRETPSRETEKPQTAFVYLALTLKLSIVHISELDGSIPYR